MPTTEWTTTQGRQRAVGLMGVAALHVLIAAAWLAGRPVLPVLPVQRTDTAGVLWLRLDPATPPHERAPQPGMPAAAQVAPVRTRAVAPPAPAPAVADAPAAPGTISAGTLSGAVPDQPALPEPGPAAPSDADADADAPSLAARARQMAGTVDKQLRKEGHKPLPALVDTPYKRFLAELEAAHAPRWSGIATVTEIPVPGTGERMAKISNGSYSYCVRIPSPSVGIDQYERMRQNPARVNCPR